MRNPSSKPKHDHHTLKFPKGFLWGAATSAYQVEGGNTNADWWQWEKKVQPKDKRSLQAADQYHLYPEDFRLAKKLLHNAHRLSIEWSRIEPEEGLFNLEAIEHYRSELKLLKKLKIKVMLTLHHFTNPKWFVQKGGWEVYSSIDCFARFVERVVADLKEYVDFWITINEPSVYTFMGYLAGTWPPQKKSSFATINVYNNLARAHVKAYQIIHSHLKNAAVGIAQNVSSFEALHHHSLIEAIAEAGLDIGNNHLFYFLSGKNTHDFLGLNYYFNRYIFFNGEASLPSFVDISTTKKAVSDLGWEIYPEGIFDVLMDFSDYHKSIYITENGLASTNDDRRCRFLIAYLQEIYHAISSGVNIKGYFHWSLIDNFEWSDGFVPRFGLVEVDYATQKRTPRPSAYVYQEIIQRNGIPHHLLRFLGHTVKAKEVLEYGHE